MISVNDRKDIPQDLRDTPIGELLEYHNLGRSPEGCSKARLLIGMCMDSRKHLNIPDNFAFIIRSGGADLRRSEFNVSYAVAVCGVGHIALISHGKCGMSGLIARKDEFVDGLVEKAGWTKEDAQKHFMDLALAHEIGNETDFVLSERDRLRNKYPLVKVEALYYRLEDKRLYLMAH
jgi:carbonic anhydrase